MEFVDVNKIEKIEDIPEEYRPYVQGVIENNKLLYGVIYFRNAEGKRKQKQYATGLKPRGNKKLAREITEQYLKDHWREYVFLPEDVEPQSSDPVYFLKEYEEWINRREEDNDVVPRVIENYESFFNKHLKSYFSTEIRIEEIKPSDLMDFFRSRKNAIYLITPYLTIIPI